MREARDRILIALDVESQKEADALLDRLAGAVTGVKVGSQLFTAAGPAAVEAALRRGFRVFLDLKFHDIPNTVAGAVREATRLGVFMLNVHAAGGIAMMRAASEAAAKAAAEFRVARPVCLGVTVLTSLDRRTLATELGVHANVPSHVLRLADHAHAAGLDGCVASPHEIALLRRARGAGWIIVTPGIRPADTDDDQARVATPAAAVRAGADYLVIGRPVTAVPEPAAAVAAILRSLPSDGAP